MLADEAADERELEKMVTKNSSPGDSLGGRRTNVEMMNAALADSEPAAEAGPRPHAFHDDPLYLAMVAHIRIT